MRLHVLLAASLVSTLLSSPSFAQDRKDEKADKEMKALLDKRSTQRLSFAERKADWKARAQEGDKQFVCDFDLTPADGDAEGPRVNVLFFPVGFEEYRAKILASWKTAKGDPITLDDQKVETLAAGELELRLIEQSGTYTHKNSPAKPGFKLLAVHIRSKGEQWTAWLIGPEKGVAKHRDDYLQWVKTAKTAAETDAVREVRFVHGAPSHGVPGPWALTAHRIGKDALHRFGIARERSWEIVVTHKAPKSVRYTCMLDGFLASTGASPGKMNLLHEAVESEEQLETVVLHKPTKRTLTYRLVKAFRDEIRDVEYAKFPEAAQKLDAMKDEQVFTVEESK